MPREAACVGELALVAQDVDKDAVAAFRVQPVDRLGEDARIIDAHVRGGVQGRGLAHARYVRREATIFQRI